MSWDETPFKSNQAWVMRRVIGPRPPGQGHSLEDMIDHDSSTMVAWCQRGGMGAHRPPAATLSHPTQSEAVTQYVRRHGVSTYTSRPLDVVKVVQI